MGDGSCWISRVCRGRVFCGVSGGERRAGRIGLGLVRLGGTTASGMRVCSSLRPCTSRRGVEGQRRMWIRWSCANGVASRTGRVDAAGAWRTGGLVEVSMSSCEEMKVCVGDASTINPVTMLADFKLLQISLDNAHSGIALPSLPGCFCHLCRTRTEYGYCSYEVLISEKRRPT